MMISALGIEIAYAAFLPTPDLVTPVATYSLAFRDWILLEIMEDWSGADVRSGSSTVDS
jgi:hypothetical protein